MIKIEGFKQSDLSRCGPASIKMVLDYYKIDNTENEIAKRCNHSFELGCTNENTIKAFKSYGLNSEIKQNCTIEQLKLHVNKEIPVIVDWFSHGVSYTDQYTSNGHYSVVIGLDDIHIHLMDPEDGEPRKLLINEFMRVWFDWEKDKILTPYSKMWYQTMIVVYKPKNFLT